ncbi:MAG: hypothetical protein EP318_19345 [Rhodobacteraceae bacterium]|nr:MAG: hypothetical protein EP318_19345 [Paracoccaceae bacterium]
MIRFLASTALALGLCASPALAQRSAAQTLALSAELYLEGVERHDPLLLLAAAKLRKSVAMTRVERVPDSDMPPPDDAEPAEPIGWQEILDAAVAMAPEDEILAGLAEDIRAESARGVKSGQVYSITSIRHGGTDTYPALTYRAGEYADVYVEGSGEADLNLFVYDTQGRLVCSDTAISAIAHCGWTPSTEAGFVIVVRNKGRGSSGYSLITN